MLFTTSTNKDLAQKVAKPAKLKLGRAAISRFADGEISVFIKDKIKNKKVYVLGSSYPPADNLLELLLLINTLKVNGAKKVTAIIPYWGYAKADHLDPYGVTLAAKLMADYLKLSGASKVLTVNLHSEKAESFLGSALEKVDALPLLADWFQAKKIKNLAIVSPDRGGLKRAQEFAKILKVKNVAWIKKYHPALNQVAQRGMAGRVKNKNVIIVDDMVQSGQTIVQAIKELKKHQVKDLYLAIVHLVKTGPGVEKLIKDKNFKAIVLTNTIPQATKLPSKFKILDISGLIIKKLTI